MSGLQNLPVYATPYEIAKIVSLRAIQITTGTGKEVSEEVKKQVGSNDPIEIARYELFNNLLFDFCLIHTVGNKTKKISTEKIRFKV